MATVADSFLGKPVGYLTRDL
uniref:Uncharacterized protein n=1 Tax=Anguilla anguilla TaxID=7936 RepID=A0A0E9SM32_ANGAN